MKNSDEMWQVLGKREMHTKSLRKTLKERNHLEVKLTKEDSIKTNIKETALDGVDWIELAQDGGCLNTVMNFWFPKNSENFKTSLVTVSF
jgi:hypothetical protein